MFAIEHVRRTQHFTMKSNHFHEAYEIYYLVKGTRDYFIKDKTYRVQDGTIVFIDCYDLHRTIDTGVPGHERYLINFTEEYIETVGQRSLEVLQRPFKSEARCCQLNRQQRSQVEHLFRQMVLETKEQKMGSDLLLRSLLTQLLVVSSRILEEDNGQGLTDTNIRHRKISEIVKFISLHYKEPLSLSTVAGHFFLNPSYLSRVFKEATGFTFVEYVNNVRIVEAQRLLRESDMKVFHIALEVGFENIAHFGRVFKQVSAMSPLQYRRTYT